MSYHILQQFDEQWLADLLHDNEKKQGQSLMASAGDERQAARRPQLAARENHRWAVVVAAILMALFALDVSHRAETLQQRLDALETQMKR